MSEGSERLMRVVGITARTQNAPGKAENDIPALWERFFTEEIPARVEGRDGGAIVALYTDYEGDHTQPYTILIGCPVHDDAEVPEGFESREIPKGTYAEYNCAGPMPETLLGVWMEVWQTSMARTYKVDFEVYPEEHWTAPEPSVAVYVGIEPEEEGE